MINIESERLVPIGKAVKYIPGRPHISAIYRWIGRADNPLETVKVGGRRFTSVEAISRFVERGTTGEPTPTAAMSARRQREVAAAEARLDAAGVK